MRTSIVMKSKLKLLILASIACVAFIFVGCAIPFDNKLTADTPYEEWIEAIDLYGKKNIRLEDYIEENNAVILEISCTNIEGYSELNSLIVAHNSFVDNNKDYFGDEKICIQVVEGNSKVKNVLLTYYNEGIDSYSIDLGDDLKREKTKRLEYLDLDTLQNAEVLCDEGIHFNASVVSIYQSYGTHISKKDLEILQNIDGLEQVVVFNMLDDDIDELCKIIWEYRPGIPVCECDINGEYRTHNP